MCLCFLCLLVLIFVLVLLRQTSEVELKENGHWTSGLFIKGYSKTSLLIHHLKVLLKSMMLRLCWTEVNSCQ